MVRCRSAQQRRRILAHPKHGNHRKVSYRYDIAVVGAGPAGLAAASVAAESGHSVAVLDDTPWLGGQIWRGQQARPSIPQARKWLDRFRHSGARLLEGTSVIAAPEPGVLMAEHETGPRRIYWHKLILA